MLDDIAYDACKFVNDTMAYLWNDPNTFASI